VPGKGAEAHDEQQEEDVVDVQPVLPEGLENLMWTASTPSPSPPAPSL
jgi:hypothetical protein